MAKLSVAMPPVEASHNLVLIPRRKKQGMASLLMIARYEDSLIRRLKGGDHLVDQFRRNTRVVSRSDENRLALRRKTLQSTANGGSYIALRIRIGNET